MLDVPRGNIRARVSTGCLLVINPDAVGGVDRMGREGKAAALTSVAPPVFEGGGGTDVYDRGGEKHT